MKTREEIMKEYYLRMHTNHETWLEVDASNRAWRDAALAELDDPMLRLITAAKKVDHGHLGSTNPAIYTSWHRPSAATITGCQRCQEYVDLRDAIDYAEQQRVQE